jgi:Uma2 family endonuclease
MQQRQIMPGHAANLVTAEEFARIPDDNYHHELVEGRVVRVSPPGSRHGALIMRIGALLHQHVESQRAGAVLVTAGFKIAADPDTVREPDIAFIRAERIPSSGIPVGFWPGPPDLAIEIRSPGDRLTSIRVKVADYLARGVCVVWVVDPAARAVTVHRTHSPAMTLSVDDEIDGSDVVRGFNCRVARFFE